MKNIFYFLSIFIFITCGKEKIENSNIENVRDSIVVKKKIPLDFNNKILFKKTISYTLVLGKDTSDFQIFVSQAKKNQDISIYTVYNLKKEKSEKLYVQRLKELKYLLKVVNNDFNLNYLSSLYLGRLIYNGDIALTIMKLYNVKFGKNSNVLSPDKISDLILESKLTDDINSILSQYSKKISDVGLEKITFVPKEELISSSLLSKESKYIPSRVLDCWIDLKVSDK